MLCTRINIFVLVVPNCMLLINYIFEFECQGRKHKSKNNKQDKIQFRLHRDRTNKLARDVYVNLDNGIGSEQGMHINNSLTTNCMKFFMKYV